MSKPRSCLVIEVRPQNALIIRGLSHNLLVCLLTSGPTYRFFAPSLLHFPYFSVIHLWSFVLPLDVGIRTQENRASE